jgi:hypothetical protein
MALSQSGHGCRSLLSRRPSRALSNFDAPADRRVALRGELARSLSVNARSSRHGRASTLSVKPNRTLLGSIRQRLESARRRALKEFMDLQGAAQRGPARRPPLEPKDRIRFGRAAGRTSRSALVVAAASPPRNLALTEAAVAVRKTWPATMMGSRFGFMLRARRLVERASRGSYVRSQGSDVRGS